jgi:hypothetical protein
MKLNEIAYKSGYQPSAIYKGKDGINWDIPDNPDYERLPELQNDVFAGLTHLDPDDRAELLAKYGVHNSVQLHALSGAELLKLVAEIKTLLNIQN